MSEQLTKDLCQRGFHIADDFLPQSTYQTLRQNAELMHNSGRFREAKIGKGLNSSLHSKIRSDQICWLDEEDADIALQNFFSKIKALAISLNQSLFLGLMEFECHFAIFKPGTFYKKHVDQFMNTKTRRISFVYYLNKNWQESFGGELKLYDQQDQLLSTVKPEANRFICFNSDLPHEVCETKETRYSLTGWLKTMGIENCNF